MALVILGLGLFVQGLTLGLFPIGESMGGAFAEKGSLLWLLVFAFALGVGTTVVEPALVAVASEAAFTAVDAGLIPETEAAMKSYAGGLRYTVAASVGVALVIGVWRILKGWPLPLLIISGYMIVVVLTFFAPLEIVGIAYDSGGVTTSTVTVPRLRTVCVGFVLVVLGLALFLVGLEEALFPLGKSMALQLTQKAYVDVADTTTGAIAWYHYAWVYLFAAAISFSTTIAAPALIAVSLKASENSGGGLSSWGLRVAVAVGVTVGVALGTFRIVTGLPLQYFIIVGYGVVIVQTIFARKWIIPLAYDSGGVTTPTVTVPLVTALGLGGWRARYQGARP